MQKAFACRLGAVAHPQPRGTVNALSQFHDFVSVVREFAIKCRLRCVPPRAAAIEEATQTSRAALRPGIAAVVKISVRLDCGSEPSRFRSNAQVCEFQTAHHSVNACVVSSRGFGSAARFCMFQLWVQERTATHPNRFAEPFFAHW